MGIRQINEQLEVNGVSFHDSTLAMLPHSGFLLSEKEFIVIILIRKITGRSIFI